MNKSIVFKTSLVFFFSIILIACGSSRKLKNFSSDGCSMFPDKSLIDSTTWCSCCFVHDIAYWQGGTKEERLLADRQFRECILRKTNDPCLADLMFMGVRLGGSPYFPTWYRWGYGWTYTKGYAPLDTTEKNLAQKLLQDYFRKNPEGGCDCGQ